MANVPYNDSGAQSVLPETRAPDDYQRIQATPSSFGGTIAQGEEQAGQSISKAGQLYSQVAADDASNNFQDAADQILHGAPGKMVPGPDGKPQPDLGYLGLRGRAASDARASTVQQVDDLLKQTRSGLYTTESQIRFDSFSRRYRSILFDRIGSHADQQMNEWYKTVNGATVQTGLRNISANPTDPYAVAAGAADATHGLVKNAMLNGAQPGDPVWNEAVAKGKQAAVQTQVEALMTPDPAMAKRILDTNKGALDPQVYESLVNRLRQPIAGAVAPEAVRRAAGSGVDPASVIRGAEGFRSQPYWDVNHWRVGYGSDTATRADGTVEPVTAFTAVSRADAERDLQRRIQQTQAGVQAQVGVDAWGALSSAAQAALTSTAYNYGHLPRSVAAAVQSGNSTAVAQAVNALGADNGGVNAARRAQEARAIMSGGAAAPAQPVGDASQNVLQGTQTPAQRSMASVPSGLPSQAEAERHAIEMAGGDVQQQRANVAAVKELYVASQANFVEQERAQRVAKQQRVEASDSAEEKIMADLYSPKPTITVSQIVRDSPDNPLTREARERMVAVANRVNKEEPLARVSHETTLGLLDRIRRPEGDPLKITDSQPLYDAFIDGHLSKPDFDFLRKEQQDVRTPEGERLKTVQAEFLKGMTSSITKSNPLLGQMDESGDNMLYLFNYFVNSRVQKYEAAGKDPFDLFDPSKPDYVGSPKALAPFQKTMSQSMTSVTSRLSGARPPDETRRILGEAEGAVPPLHPVVPAGAAGAAEMPPASHRAPAQRLPGETPAQYLARASRLVASPFGRIIQPLRQNSGSVLDTIEAPRLQ